VTTPGHIYLAIALDLMFTFGVHGGEEAVALDSPAVEVAGVRKYDYSATECGIVLTIPHSDS
jgi:hypothetical protein